MVDERAGAPSTLTRRVVAAADGLVMRLVDCLSSDAGWAAPEEARGLGVVFVRRGAFARRSDGVESLVDVAHAYFELPGAEEQFAHPVGHQDECLSIELAAGFLAGLGRSPADLPAAPVRTAVDIDLAHRRLVREARIGCDAFELHELAGRLLGDLLSIGDDPARRSCRVRPATAAAHRRLVGRAREALLLRPPIGLPALAREVGSSPHHLSRIFSRETGLTLSVYRNRLRLGLALARLEDGERDLARLAADLGFADHAHLTRVARALAGEPPSRLRDLLAATN